MFERRRGLVRWGALVLGLLVAASSLGAGAAWLRARSRRLELAQVREAIDAKRFGVAGERLARLADHWPADGEVLLLLGECELARGRREAALAAWARVPPASPSFARAALLRATHLINMGKYTPAEEVLLTALAREATGPAQRYELERALSRVYR